MTLWPGEMRLAFVYWVGSLPDSMRAATMADRPLGTCQGLDPTKAAVGRHRLVAANSFRFDDDWSQKAGAVWSGSACGKRQRSAGDWTPQVVLV